MKHMAQKLHGFVEKKDLDSQWFIFKKTWPKA